MLLGKSTAYRQIIATNKLQARLVLAGLYILLLMPIMMMITRVGVEILAGMLGVLFIAHSYFFKRWEWLRQPPVVIALALWAYSLLVVTPLALNPMASLSRTDWVRFILLFAAIVYWLADYQQELRRIAAILLFVMILAAVDALVQFKTGMSISGTPYLGERLTGPFSKQVIGSYLAKMSIPCLGILLYHAHNEKKKWLVALLVGLLLLLFMVILLSNERTATLTFSLGILLVGCGLFFSLKETRRIVLVAITVMIGIAAVSYQSQPTLQRRVFYTHEMLQDFGDSPYAQLWKGAIIMFHEHPFTGVGMANFREACPVLEAAKRVSFCAEHPHNFYLEWLSELGAAAFVGFVLLITSLVGVVLDQRSPHERQRNILILFALAGLLVNFFPLVATQSYFSNWPSYLAWQSIALSLAISRVAKEDAHG